jgi:hypothetical protein
MIVCIVPNATHNVAQDTTLSAVGCHRRTTAVRSQLARTGKWRSRLTVVVVVVGATAGSGSRQHADGGPAAAMAGGNLASSKRSLWQLAASCGGRGGAPPAQKHLSIDHCPPPSTTVATTNGLHRQIALLYRTDLNLYISKWFPNNKTPTLTRGTGVPGGAEKSAGHRAPAHRHSSPSASAE